MKAIANRLTQVARMAALAFAVLAVGSAWAADAPTATVSGTTVTISNESGATVWDNARIDNMSGYQGKNFTVPAIGTDLPSGTILKITSVSVAKSTSKPDMPDKLGLSGCVSAYRTVTEGGFTSASADKYTYSFADTDCLIKVGTATPIRFYQNSGATHNGAMAFRLGYNAYQFIESIVWSSKVPIIEIQAEIVTGYVGSTSNNSQSDWGFQTGSGSGKVYLSGYGNYMKTDDQSGYANDKEIVLVNGAYDYAFNVVNGNSFRSDAKRYSVWKKISGDGTLTANATGSGITPAIKIYDVSEFAGTINACTSSNSIQLFVIFCGAEESIDNDSLFNKLYTNYKGSFYVSPARTSANGNVVTVPAGKTWKANKFLNEGETVIDGTFDGAVVNTGTLTVNGTVTGAIANSGTLTINGTVTGSIANSGSGTVTVNAGATISGDFGSTRNFTGWTVDSSIPVQITMTAEEYGKGSVSVTGANEISSITVLAPDGTTTVGTITPAESSTLDTGVKVSGKACWIDYEMSYGNEKTGFENTGVSSLVLQKDSEIEGSNAFTDDGMLYTYAHPYRQDLTMPSTWTAVVRCTVPNYSDAAVIIFGWNNNYIGLVAGETPKTEMRLVQYKSGYDHYVTNAVMTVQDATTAQHVYIFAVENSQTLKVYCDGSMILNKVLDEQLTITSGFQIGSVLGGVTGGIVRFAKDESPANSLAESVQKDARIDCVRLYDYSLSADQRAALSAEFPAVKLYEATVEADADTTWGALAWSNDWDGGNEYSKVLLTVEGDATVALPESITAEELAFDVEPGSTLTLNGPGSLAVTRAIDAVGFTLKLGGTVTFATDTTFAGNVAFVSDFAKAGEGAIQLANGATVGVDAALIVTPLGTYTCAEGTVVDSAYSSGEGDVKLIPLTSADVSITQSGTTLYYSDLGTALGPLVNAPGSISDDVEVVLLKGTTLSPGEEQALISMGYYISGSTITKAVAECNNRTYSTLAAAVGAATDGATVTLLRASSEEIALNDKAITLSETANFSGTLTGNGTLTFAAFRNNPSITFNNWTGTVVLPEFAAQATVLNKYGVAGSTVVLKGITAGWLGETSPQKMDVAPVLQLDGNVTIKGFSTSWDYTFAELAGTGNFVLDPTDNSPKSATITKVAEGFTGTITNITTVTLTIGTLARKTGTSTAVEALLLSTTGDVVANALTVGGVPVDVTLVTCADGIYVAAASVTKDNVTTPYKTVSDAVQAVGDDPATITLHGDTTSDISLAAGQTLDTNGFDVGEVTTTVADSYVKHVGNVYSVAAKRTVTVSMEEHSSVTGVTDGQKFVPGDVLTIAASADEYYTATLAVNGTPVESPYEFTTTDADVTVAVTAERDYVTVTVVAPTGTALTSVASDGGEVTDNGDDDATTFSVPAGSKLTLTWAPTTGYFLDEATTTFDVGTEAISVSGDGLAVPVAAGARIGADVYKRTFADAVTDAEDGDTVTLLAASNDAVALSNKTITFVENGFAFGGTLTGDGTIIVETAPSVTTWAAARFVADGWTGTFVVGWDMSGKMMPDKYGITGSTVEVSTEVTSGYFNTDSSGLAAPSIAPALYFDKDVTINDGFGGSNNATTFAKVGMAANKTFTTRGNNTLGRDSYYTFTELNGFDGTLFVRENDHVTIGSVTVPEQPAANTVVVKVAKGDNARLEGYPKAKYPGDQVSLVYSDSIKDGESGYYKAVAGYLHDGLTIAFYASFADVVEYYENNYQDGDAIRVADAEADGVPVGWEITASGNSQWLTKIRVPITWDVDGVQTVTDVDYGDTPAYTGGTPTRTATPQYTYTFAGWTPEVVPATATATYTAQFSETVNQYTLTVPVVENATATVTVGGEPTDERTFDYGTVVTVTWAPVSSAWKVTSNAQVIELTGNVMAEEPTVAPNEKTFTVVVPDNMTVTVDGVPYTANTEITRTIGTSVTIVYTVAGQFVGETQQQEVEITGDTVTIGTPDGYVAPVPAVAEVGGVYKATLAEAVAAVEDGGTVTMLASHNVGTARIQVSEKSFTVALNGTTLSSDEADAIIFRVSNGKTITIDGTVEGSKLSGSVMIAGGTEGHIVANGGTYENDLYCPFYANGTCSVASTISIAGATIVANDTNPADSDAETGFGLYQAGPATVTITDTEITAAKTGVEVRAGSLTIEGTVITANGDPSTATANGNGGTVVGAAIAVSPHNTNKSIELTVNSGTFTGVKAVYENYLQAQARTATTSIALNGGTFLGDIEIVEDVGAVISANSTARFSDATADGVEEGYGLVPVANSDLYEVVKFFSVTYKNGDEVLWTGYVAPGATTPAFVGEDPTKDDDVEDNGTTTKTVTSYAFVGWGEVAATVTEDVVYTATFNPTVTVTTYVATVNNERYETLAEAMAVGGTVTLLKDVVLDELVEVEGEVVLDMAGFTVSSAQPYIFEVTSTGDLTITGNGAVTGPENGAAFDGKALITVDEGKLTIVNGTFTATGSGSDGMYGVYVLNGGTAVFGDQATGTGPTITSHFAAIGTNFTTAPADITVYGGVYTANATPTNNEWWYYFCASVYAAGSGEYTLAGGVFNGYYGVSARYADADQTVSVGDVTINAASGTQVFVDSKKGAGGEEARTVVATSDAVTAPAGYKWVETANGYELAARDYVAQVGSTKYESLAEAMAAAQDGGTVTMLADVTLTAPMDVQLGGKAVTLDLGGRTLTGRTNLKSGSLTVQNGTVVGGAQQALNVYGSATPAENYSVLTIAGDVTVTADVYGVCLFGPTYSAKSGYGAVINLAGTVTTTGDGRNGAVFVSGNLGNNVAGDANNIINVTGSITSATDAAIALNGLATVNVAEGAVVVGDTAIAVKRGTLNVTGGTVHATGAKNYGVAAYGNGTEMTGAAISITDTYNKYGPMSVAVSGGVITSDNADALFKKEGAYTNDATMTVTGGEFSSAVPVEFCATGFIPADNGSGSYGVTPGWVITFDVEGVQTQVPTAAGEMPAYDGTPAKAEDDDYTYTFAGWTPMIVAATEAVTYTATFTPVPKDVYDVTLTLSSAAIKVGTTTTLTVNISKNGTPFSEMAEYSAEKTKWSLVVEDGECASVTKGPTVYSNRIIYTLKGLKAGATTLTYQNVDNPSLRFTVELTVNHNLEVSYDSSYSAQKGALVENGLVAFTSIKLDGVEVEDRDAYTFTSEDTSIATVDKTGVTPVGVGFTYVNITLESDPTITLRKAIKVVAAAAKIGDDYYATIADAFTAATDGQTIVLLKDVTESADYSTSDIEVTLDLNGFTWTGASNREYTLRVRKGVVTVTDNSSGHTGAVTYGKDYAFIVDHVAADGVRSQLILNSGTFTGKTSVVQAGTRGGSGANTKYYGGDLVVNGGTFVTVDDTNDEHDTNGHFKYTLNKLDVGSVTVFTPSTITVNGGTFQNFDPANNVAEGTGTNFVPAGYVSLANTPSEGLYTVTGLVTFAVTAPAHTVVTVPGATNNGDGTFTVAPGTVVTIVYTAEEGYVFADNTTVKNVSYTANGGEVAEAEAAVAAVAKINTTLYSSLEAALAAAQGGDTVTLLKDCEGEGIFLGSSNAKTVTIDFGGFTYTVVTPVGSSGTVNQMLHFEAGNTVTLTNGTIKKGEGATGFEMVMQNYCNLTIDGMEIDGTGIEVATYSDPKYQAYPVWYNTAKPQFNYNGSGTSVIRDSTITVVGDFGIDDTAKVTIEGDALINANKIATKGTDERYASANPTITVKNGAAFSFDCSAILADDQNVVEEDGVYTVTGKTYVAQIGTTKYETLVAAVAAANAATGAVTIELLSDLDFSEEAYAGYKWAGSTYNPLTIANDGVTIDLGGHTIRNMGNCALVFGHILAKDGRIANCAIRNGTLLAGTTGDVRNSYVLGIAGVDGMTIENVTTLGGINVYTASTGVVIDGCTVQGTKYYTVCAQCGSQVTIRGTTYTKNTDSTVANKSMFWIQGAGSDSDLVTTGNTTGAFGTSIISIEGGDFTVDTANGGAFYLASGVTPTVSGGTFNIPVPANCCAVGFEPAGEEAPYTVKVKETAAVVTTEVEPGNVVTNAVLELTAEAAEAIIADSGKTLAEALVAEDANGLKKWENYVLDIDTTEPEEVKAPAVQAAASDTKEEAKLNLSFTPKSTATTGIKVSYKVDTVTVDNGVATTNRADTATAAPAVKLDDLEAGKTKYVTVRAVLTSSTGTETEVEVQKVVGVMAVNSTQQNTIVAVPWESFNGTSITANELVYTGNRTAGDTLTVYVPSTGKYKTWTLDADGGSWASVTTYSLGANGDKTNQQSGNAVDQLIPRGAGVWVYRQNVDEKIYLLGQKPEAETATVTVEKGYNLVAPVVTDSSQTTIAVNEVVPVAEEKVEATANDKVLIPVAGKAPYNLYYNKTLKKWGYDLITVGDNYTVTKEFVEEVSIPTGTGFWYISGANGNKDITIGTESTTQE